MYKLKKLQNNDAIFLMGNTKEKIDDVLFTANFLFLFVIEQAVTVALELRVANLFAEFLTHTAVFFRSLKPTRAVSTRAL